MTCLDLTTISPRELAERAGDELEGAPPLEVLRWAVDRFSPRFAITASMQDTVLLHMISRVDHDVPVVFLDTGYHFAETIGTADAVEAVYDLKLLRVRPQLTVEQQDAGLRPKDLYERDPDLCCRMRKVTPARVGDARLRRLGLGGPARRERQPRERPPRRVGREQGQGQDQPAGRPGRRTRSTSTSRPTASWSTRCCPRATEASAARPAPVPEPAATAAGPVRTRSSAVCTSERSRRPRRSPTPEAAGPRPLGRVERSRPDPGRPRQPRPRRRRGAARACATPSPLRLAAARRRPGLDRTRRSRCSPTSSPRRTTARRPPVVIPLLLSRGTHLARDLPAGAATRRSAPIRCSRRCCSIACAKPASPAAARWCSPRPDRPIRTGIADVERRPNCSKASWGAPVRAGFVTSEPSHRSRRAPPRTAAAGPCVSARRRRS